MGNNGVLCLMVVTTEDGGEANAERGCHILNIFRIKHMSKDMRLHKAGT